jgi:hypothetical protein
MNQVLIYSAYRPNYPGVISGGRTDYISLID